MSWLNWIGNPLIWTPKRAAEKSRRRRSELTRLLVELLEDRSVPTTFTWLGADAGDWNLGTNWDQGTAPGTDAAVVINNGTTPLFNTTVEINTLSIGNTSGIRVNGGTLTIKSDSTLTGNVTVTGGTVNVGDADGDVVTMANLFIGPNFSQGTVNVTGTLHVTGALDLGRGFGTGNLGGSGAVTVGGLLSLFHGTMSGAGTTTANGGLSLQINGGGFNLVDGRHLDNNATATWTSDNGQPLILKNGAVLNNNNNGTFDIQVDSQFANANAAGDQSIAINNSGTFKKTAAGTISINVPFNNNGGTVAVQTGEMAFRGGGTSIGPWTVAASANLSFFSGVWTLGAGSKVSGAGAVNFNGGTVNLADTYNVAATAFHGGSANFNAAAETVTLVLGGGTLGGAGNFTISGLLTWSNEGNMTGAGTTFANGGIDINITGGNTGLNGRRLDNNGTATITNNLGLVFMNGAVFNNNGTFDAQTDVGISNIGGTASVFNNIGTFKKSAGNGTTTINVPFNNLGTVEARSGSLSLTSVTATSTLTSGIWKVFTNSTLTLQGGANLTNNATILLDGANSTLTNNITTNSGSFTIQNGRNFNPAIAFNNTGNVFIGANSTFTLSNGGTSTGDWDVAATGALNFTAGSYLLDNGADITGAGFPTIAGGTVNVGDAPTDSVNASRFALSFGILDGPGTLHVNNTLNWSSGTMQGSGTTHVANTATFTMNGNNPNLDTRTLINDGTATTSINGGLSFLNGAVFDNNGSLTSTNSSTFSSGGGTFRNDGSFTKTGAGSTTRFNSVFDNNGTVSVLSGSLDLGGGGTSTGATFALSSSANLLFSAGYTLDTTSSISGAGAVDFRNNGTVTVNGSYTITGQTTISNITNFNTPTTFPILNLSGTLGGNGNVLITSALSWTGNGTMTGGGTTTVANTATFTMSANNTFLDGRTLINNATATLSGGGALSFLNGAVFDNNGSFTTTGSFAYANGTGGGVFHNTGSFTRTGAGSTTTFQPAFTNGGTIAVETGVLSLTGGLSNYSAANKTLTGGTYLISATFRFAGADIVTNAANIVLNGAGASAIQDGFGANALTNFTSNVAAGTFSLQNGQNFTASGAFSNAGVINVGVGSTFGTAAGNFTQTAGTTTVLGTLSPASAVDTQGGTLKGSGTIGSNLVNAGIVAPGTSPGRLTTDGSFAQTAAGSLHVEIAGVNPTTPDFDQLQIDGAATLSGTLNVSLLGGFRPAVGDTFTIVNKTSAGAIVGTFNNLAEGNAFNVGTARFAITYHGGDGNDVALTRINIAPTMDAIADPSAILEDAAIQTINFTGVGAGGDESQTLTVTASSSNPGLISNPTVNYTSQNSTGSLSYKPVANQSGTAIITVTVTDNGGTANGGVNTFSRTFTVTVTPVNDAPTLDAIPDTSASQDDGVQIVNLAGISAGGGESQTPTVAATSSNPNLIPDPTVNYTSPNATGTLSYAPTGILAGSAVITVRVTDNGDNANGGVNTFIRTFTVTVTEVNNALHSSVKPLPAVSAPSFMVTWSGADDSGVTQLAAFDIFVSTDGGPFVLFQQNATATSAVFAGELGRTYGFASVAIDSAGHRERLPATPDTVTNTALFQRDLTPITEDTKAPASVTVATLLGAAMSDADAGVLRGIAVTGVSGGGVWQFSADGITFKPMSTASEDAAWLLPESFKVRFVPAANIVGTAGLVFRGWDRTWGVSGARAAVPVGESASPFSAEGGFARVQISPINDRPVLPATPAPQLLPTPRSPAAPAGQAVSALLRSATDVDGNTLGAAVTGLAGAGVWQFSLDGGATFTNVGPVSGTSALLLGPTDLVRFVPNASATGQATLTVKAWDQTSGQRGGHLNSTLTTATAFSAGSTMGVTRINGAPTLTGANPTLTMKEDQSPNAGFAVSNLLTGRFADDALAAQGVAITAADALGHGAWFFTTNGTTFQPIGAVSNSAALLLRSTDKVRFVPNADFNGAGAATLTFRAWDQTFGFTGKVADVSNFFTGAFFSSASLTATLDVTPVADRPVLDVSVKPALSSFLPGGALTTARVADLLSGRVHDADRPVTAMAVTGVAGGGVWGFSLDAGVTFAPIGTVSATSGRLLNGDALVRFTPNATFRGVASMSFKAWDETVGAPGTINAIASTSLAFSKEIGAATVAVNTAPVLNAAGAPTLPTILEDSKSPAGAAVSTLLGASVTDADGASVPKGIAVTALSGVTNGTWQFSTNGGTTFAPVGSVSDTSALLLRSTDKLRFVPVANFHGQASATFRAWDQTAGVFGKRGDASTSGGSSAFSTATKNATITVTSVNDAPLLLAGLTAGKMHLPSVPVGTSSPAGVRVGDLVSAGFIDAEGDPLGVAVFGLTGGANGQWQFSTDGTNWQNVGTVSTSAALLLAHNDFIRFVPKAGFVGSAEIRFRAWDETKGTALSRVSLSSTQLTGSLSAKEFAAPVWVNSRPVLSAS